MRALASAMLLFASGCGLCEYRAGARSLYPPQIRTVAVNVFESDSYRRNLGERLTEAVIKEIERRTPLKVVSAAHADSFITGRILSDRKTVLIENPQDEPRDLEFDLSVEVSWLDGRGQSLLGNTIVSPRPVLRLAEDSNFIPESGQSLATSQQETIQRLAQQIVDQMEIRW